MVDLESELLALLRDFTSRVGATVRQYALESANAALSVSAQGSATDIDWPQPTRAKASARTPKVASRKAPFDAVAAGPQVVSFLLANPGLRMVELGARLKIPTSSLKPLVKKLVGNRMLRAEGNTRGRRYFASRYATSATVRGRIAKK